MIAQTSHNNIINQIANFNKHIELIQFVPHLSSHQCIRIEPCSHVDGQVYNPLPLRGCLSVLIPFFKAVMQADL